MKARTARVSRDTLETQIEVTVNLDGAGVATLATGIPFLDHMLDQIARHGLIDLAVKATGDLQIDPHHTVEDIGITLGQAVAKAVGDKKGTDALRPCVCAARRGVVARRDRFLRTAVAAVPRAVHALACG